MVVPAPGPGAGGDVGAGGAFVGEGGFPGAGGDEVGGEGPEPEQSQNSGGQLGVAALQFELHHASFTMGEIAVQLRCAWAMAAS